MVLSFFFSFVYPTRPIPLSLLLSTQTYVPRLVHPLPNGFPRSNSTRVTTGPVTYSSNRITFTAQLYTSCFLNSRISPAVRLLFGPIVIPACSCPLEFSHPDLKPHPFSISYVTCYIKFKPPFYSGI